MQIWSFFWNDRTFYWADLEADPAVYAGCKVNPVPVRTLGIFTWAFVDTSNGASINAIRNTFTSIGNNCVWHSVFSL